MTGIFKANNPYNSFLLFFYGLLLKAPMFIHASTPKPQIIDGFLYKFFIVWLNQLGHTVPVIYSIIAYLLLYTQAITFNKLVNDQRLLQKPNYLTGMAYLLLTSLFTEWNILSAPLIVNTLLLWVWARLSSLYNNQHPGKTLFNIGFAISICTFFYFPSLAFIALIVFGLAITRSFKITEWIMVLIGILTPYYFLLSYLFLMDRWKEYHVPTFAVYSPQISQSIGVYAAIILLILACLTGMYFVQQNFRKQLIQSRKSWSLILLYLGIALFVPFLNAIHSFEYWILCAIPLSAFISCAFLYPQNKWFPIILHWLMVAFVVGISYFMR